MLHLTAFGMFFSFSLQLEVFVIVMYLIDLGWFRN